MTNPIFDGSNLIGMARYWCAVLVSSVKNPAVYFHRGNLSIFLGNRDRNLISLFALSSITWVAAVLSGTWIGWDRSENNNKPQQKWSLIVPMMVVFWDCRHRAETEPGRELQVITSHREIIIMMTIIATIMIHDSKYCNLDDDDYSYRDQPQLWVVVCYSDRYVFILLTNKDEHMYGTHCHNHQCSMFLIFTRVRIQTYIIR